MYLLSTVRRFNEAPTTADYLLQDHLSICLLCPLTDSARAWLDEHIEPDAQWFGRSLVIEPRYVSDIVEGIYHDGFWITQGTQEWLS